VDYFPDDFAAAAAVDGHPRTGIVLHYSGRRRGRERLGLGDNALHRRFLLNNCLSVASC